MKFATRAIVTHNVSMRAPWARGLCTRNFRTRFPGEAILRRSRQFSTLSLECPTYASQLVLPDCVLSARKSRRLSVSQTASTMSEVISTEAPRCRKFTPTTNRQPPRFCSSVPVNPASAPRQTRTAVPGSSRSSAVTGTPA